MNNEWPATLRLRDTGLHDDMGGPGQRIFTTAGAGYKKVEYVRFDLVRDELAVVETLLNLAYAAWRLADNTEDSGREGLTVQRSDFDLLSKHLDALDELPDDQPGYTMGEAAKARWALRRVLGPLPPNV